jgi:hypothetical protein
MIWLKAILIIVVCGLLAYGGTSVILIIKPLKGMTTFIWALLFSMLIICCELYVAYYLDKKTTDIRKPS